MDKWATHTNTYAHATNEWKWASNNDYTPISAPPSLSLQTLRTRMRNRRVRLLPF